MVKFIKIITTILLSLVFILGIFISCVMLWVPKFDAFIGGILFILVLYNFLMLYYVNWAIWTKGKAKKAIMAFVIFSLFILFCLIITYE